MEDRISKEHGQELANRVSRMVNIMTTKPTKAMHVFVEELSHDHRTLQQTTFRMLIIPLLEQWAKMYESGWYDDRNEATVKLSKRMLAAIKDEPIPFI